MSIGGRAARALALAVAGLAACAAARAGTVTVTAYDSAGNKITPPSRIRIDGSYTIDDGSANGKTQTFTMNPTTNPCAPTPNITPHPTKVLLTLTVTNTATNVSVSYLLNGTKNSTVHAVIPDPTVVTYEAASLCSDGAVAPGAGDAFPTPCVLPPCIPISRAGRCRRR